MRDVDLLVSAVLRSIRPRSGFATELGIELSGRPPRLIGIEPSMQVLRARWVVAGAAVAGVVSATGAVYLGRRRHRRAA